jgi:hypothetical protein
MQDALGPITKISEMLKAISGITVTPKVDMSGLVRAIGQVTQLQNLMANIGKGPSLGSPASMQQFGIPPVQQSSIRPQSGYNVSPYILTAPDKSQLGFTQRSGAWRYGFQDARLGGYNLSPEEMVRKHLSDVAADIDRRIKNEGQKKAAFLGKFHAQERAGGFPGGSWSDQPSDYGTPQRRGAETLETRMWRLDPNAYAKMEAESNAGRRKAIAAAWEWKNAEKDNLKKDTETMTAAARKEKARRGEWDDGVKRDAAATYRYNEDQKKFDLMRSENARMRGGFSLRPDQQLTDFGGLGRGAPPWGAGGRGSRTGGMFEPGGAVSRGLGIAGGALRGGARLAARGMLPPLLYIPAYGAVRAAGRAAGALLTGTGEKGYQESMFQMLPMAGSVDKVLEWESNIRSAIAPFFGTPSMNMEAAMDAATDIGGVTRWGNLGVKDPKAFAGVVKDVMLTAGLTKGKAKDIMSVAEAWKHSPEYKGMTDAQQMAAITGQMQVLSAQAGGYTPQLIAMMSQGGQSAIQRGSSFAEFGAKAYSAIEFGIKAQAIGTAEKGFTHPANMKKIAAYLLAGRESKTGGFMGGSLVFPDKALNFTKEMRAQIKANPKLKHLIDGHGDLRMSKIRELNAAAPEARLPEYGGLSMMQYLNQLANTPEAEGGGEMGVFSMVSGATERMAERGFHPESMAYSNRQLMQVVQMYRNEFYRERAKELTRMASVQAAAEKKAESEKLAKELQDRTPYGATLKFGETAAALANKKATEWNFPEVLKSLTDTMQSALDPEKEGSSTTGRALDWGLNTWFRAGQLALFPGIEADKFVRYLGEAVHRRWLSSSTENYPYAGAGNVDWFGQPLDKGGYLSSRSEGGPSYFRDWIDVPQNAEYDLGTRRGGSSKTDAETAVEQTDIVGDSGRSGAGGGITTAGAEAASSITSAGEAVAKALRVVASSFAGILPSNTRIGGASTAI